MDRTAQMEALAGPRVSCFVKQVAPTADNRTIDPLKYQATVILLNGDSLHGPQGVTLTTPCEVTLTLDRPIDSDALIKDITADDIADETFFQLYGVTVLGPTAITARGYRRKT